MASRRAISFLALVVTSALLSGAKTYAYPTDALRREVQQAVDGVLTEKDPELIEQSWPELIAYTVAEASLTAVSIESESEISAVAMHDIEVAETARTDKQIGSGSNTTGSTSAILKAGVARLLGLAIEHGAVQQEQNGTSMTLSTTPYALGVFATGAEDNAENYRRWRPAAQIGMSANFALDSSNDSAVGDADFDDLSTLSVKWNFFDRSPRSEWFLEQWKTFRPAIEDRLVDLSGLLAKTLNNDPELNRLSTDLEDHWRRRLADEVGKLGKKEASAELRARMEQELLKDLHDKVFEIYAKRPNRDEAYRAAVQALSASNRRYREEREKFLKLVDDANKKPTGSVAFTNNRVDDGTDYSAVTLVFQGGVALFDVAVNAEVSFNHHPDSDKDQNSVRDYSGSVSAERTFDNVLFDRLNGEGDLSKITLAASGKVSYLKEVDDAIGIAQLRVDVPVYGGFTVPLALTYASRTEEEDKSEFRVNVGVDLDTDKLMALARIGGLALAGNR